MEFFFDFLYSLGLLSLFLLQSRMPADLLQGMFSNKTPNLGYFGPGVSTYFVKEISDNILGNIIFFSKIAKFSGFVHSLSPNH